MTPLIDKNIIRFNSSDTIEFENETYFQPHPGQEYIFGVEKVDESTVILLDEDKFGTHYDGIVRSERIPRNRITIVGDTQVIIVSKYKDGYAALMGPRTKQFLEYEILSHENMDVEAALNHVCDLHSAQGTLEQMPDEIFVDVMELVEDANITDIRKGVESEIEDLIDTLGGDSLLRDIIVWN